MEFHIPFIGYFYVSPYVSKCAVCGTPTVWIDDVGQHYCSSHCAEVDSYGYDGYGYLYLSNGTYRCRSVSQVKEYLCQFSQHVSQIDYRTFVDWETDTDYHFTWKGAVPVAVNRAFQLYYDLEETPRNDLIRRDRILLEIKDLGLTDEWLEVAQFFCEERLWQEMQYYHCLP